MSYDKNRKLRNIDQLEAELSSMLSIKFGNEKGIKETFDKDFYDENKYIYMFEGSECRIAEGVIIIKECQDIIDEIVEELIARRNSK